jgi:hypothetical protein
VVVQVRASAGNSRDASRCGKSHDSPYQAKTAESWFHGKVADVAADGPHYTVVSPHLDTEVAALEIAEPMYIPNGVFTPGRETFEPICHTLDTLSEATFVFNIGSFSMQKRADTFARVMRHVTRTHGGTHIVVAGDGTLRDAVEACASERFHPVGFVDNETKWR